MLTVESKLNIYRRLTKERRYGLARKFEDRHAWDAEFMLWIKLWKALVRGMMSGIRQRHLDELAKLGPSRN